MGQFTQIDPIGMAGGLNLYGYANSDPVNFRDPSGLSACEGYDDVISCINGAVDGTNTNDEVFTFDFEDCPHCVVVLGQAGRALGLRIGQSLAATLVAMGAVSGNAGVRTISNSRRMPERLVTVLHFTDPATAAAIEASGYLRVFSFVTLPGEVAGLGTPHAVEQRLEIAFGRGAMVGTFRVPASSLLPSLEGPLTSGGAIQFQLGRSIPVTPGTFRPFGVGR